ncbi:hypothetical protein BGP_3122 [Beggiatoa sp. PS]|nr:hypothetical protein BGP_3122 [Beggiatoa sp. PS]
MSYQIPVWLKYGQNFKDLEHNKATMKYRISIKVVNNVFYWVNGIHYAYGNNKGILISVVVCEEKWQEVDPNTGEKLDKNSRHVWISSQFLNKHDVHERCNLGARSRWGIENSINTEKRRGYCYEHPFSYDFTAMQNYHYLMRMAHALNALALNTKLGAKFVRKIGIQPFLKLVRETLTGLWLTIDWMALLLTKPFQLRLIE